MKKTIAISMVLFAAVVISAPMRSMVAARASINASAPKTEYTAKDYIQDGLVAMWDAKENVGYGIHDEGTLWKDVVGGLEFQVVEGYSGPTVSTDRLVFSSNTQSIMCDVSSLGLRTAITIEVVFVRYKTGWNNMFFQFNPYASQARGYYGAFHSRFWGNANYIGFNGNVQYNLYSDSLNIVTSYTYADKAIYRRGIYMGTMSTSYSSQLLTSLYLGANIRNNSFHFEGDMFNVRLYNRILTEEEIQHNYLVDKERFNLP